VGKSLFRLVISPENRQSEYRRQDVGQGVGVIISFKFKTLLVPPPLPQFAWKAGIGLAFIEAIVIKFKEFA